MDVPVSMSDARKWSKNQGVARFAHSTQRLHITVVGLVKVGHCNDVILGEMRSGRHNVNGDPQVVQCGKPATENRIGI